ncbi:MAG: hypothetical protein HZA21_02450 [Nitrospirae bacterium]|nr:hypothetical protein [Nitrospirota bacterium]
MLAWVLIVTVIGMAVVAALAGGFAVLNGIITHAPTVKEFTLTLVVLACGAIPVNIFVFGPADILTWSTYFWSFTIPSTVLALAILAYAFWARGTEPGMHRFFNRYWVGIWAGVAGTIVLDAVRLTGYKLGWMPYDVPRMAGTMILGTMLTGPTPLSDFIGYANHFWIGANIGFLYTLLFGRTHWLGSVWWLLFYEAGMMISPAVIMMAGPFGLNFGYGILAVSFTAHVVFGIVQGALVQRFVKERGTLLRLVEPYLAVPALRMSGP